MKSKPLYDQKWGKYTQDYLLSKMDDYKAAKTEYDEFLDWMANDIWGTALKPPLKIASNNWEINWKWVARALEKAYGKQNWVDWVTDIVRGTTVVKDAEWMEKAKQWIEDYAKKNNIDLKKDLDYEDKFTNPTNLWYKDLSFIYTTKNWVRSEVQINTPEMLVAKEWKEAIKMKAVTEQEYKDIVEKAWVEWWLWHK